MEQPNGHPCPECGAPREPDNTPSCTCTQRASEALRETRTAEAAAAEDFDPLRIRPYVELGGGTADRPDSGAADSAGGGTADSAGDVTADSAGGGTADSAGGPQGREGAAQGLDGASQGLDAASQGLDGAPQGLASAARERASAAQPAPDATSVLPAPLVPPTTEPNATDLSLLEGTEPDPAGPGPYETGEERPRRRRRAAVLAVTGALVAVVAAAGYASGLFSYEKPSRDTALPEDIRASVPDTSTSPPSEEPARTTPSVRPSSAAPSPSPSASASPSPSPAASSASPSPTKPTEPTSPTPTASGSSPESDDAARERGNPVLRRGDRGPEVTELQLRLRQLYLYNGEADGHFTTQVEGALRNYQWSRGIRSDELGVYGEETRAKLESETKEP
ncbi:peptidoglycan-binding domain-containing protein [Streptomyces deserti]